MAAVLALLLALVTSAAAAGPFLGQPSGSLLAAGDRRVMILSPAGEVVWQYPAKLVHDAWMLPEAHVLFADGETVTEVTLEKKVVFQYKAAEQKGGGTYACQRLANGLTLIGENSTGRVLEVDTTGRIVFSLQTQPSQVGQHQNLRLARKLANGNYLVCHSGARLVKEYTPRGETVWQAKVPGALAFAAVRTPRGSTFVSSLDRLTEFDGQGEKIWEFACREAAGVVVQNLTGLQWLPNDHVVCGCYRAYQDGQGCGLLEITREKTVAWRYVNPKADGTMMAVQLLSPEGRALAGPCHR